MVERRNAGGLTRTAAAIVAGSLAVAVGCGGDGQDERPLEVVVEPTEVAAGERLRARVENRGEEPFTYGANYALERRVGDEFEAVELPRRPVPQIAYVAEPGETGPPIAVEVPAEAEPGRWRVVIPPDVAGEEPPTGEFTVTDG